MWQRVATLAVSLRMMTRLVEEKEVDLVGKQVVVLDENGTRLASPLLDNELFQLENRMKRKGKGGTEGERRRRKLCGGRSSCRRHPKSQGDAREPRGAIYHGTRLIITIGGAPRVSQLNDLFAIAAISRSRREQVSKELGRARNLY